MSIIDVKYKGTKPLNRDCPG